MRFFFVYDEKSGKVKTSHNQLLPLANFITKDKRDFQNHEGMFFSLTKEYDTLLGAFIHKTNRGQAAGGVRYWSYDDVEYYLRDGMRLGKGMTRKNALAGLWWGGGKGVIAHNKNFDKNDPKIRKYIYKEFGKLISSIQGVYVTAEDVGTTVADMSNIFSTTRFTTCIPGDYGGSGNPSEPTARGVVAGMEAALDFKNMGDLQGKTIAIQGLGNVATFLIGFLFEKGVDKIIAADINKDRVEAANNKFRDKNFEARLVNRHDSSILTEKCDIVSPNATGGVITPSIIPQIKAKIICGAANNQLEDTDRDDKILFESGITYVPDFLTNRMGIVTCANEQYGYINNDPFIENHLSRSWKFSIFQMTREMLSKSQKNNIPTAKIAVQMADELSEVNHPVFGHRGKEIINSLIENKWEWMDYDNEDWIA